MRAMSHLAWHTSMPSPTMYMAAGLGLLINATLKMFAGASSSQGDTNAAASREDDVWAQVPACPALGGCPLREGLGLRISGAPFSPSRVLRAAISLSLRRREVFYPSPHRSGY